MNEELIKKLIVPESIMEKWQRLIDALASLMDVPTAVIMKVDLPYLEAIISSNNDDNPIPRNYKEEIFGTYCEITISSKAMHHVINAYEDPHHKDGVEAKGHGLISYLGFPLEWPTGDVFGTICVVDKKSRDYSKERKDLMREMKVSVDAHLELIYKNELLKKAQEKIKEQRNNLKLLSTTVRHDIANNLTFIKGFLDVKKISSELPEDFEKELLPYLNNSIDSIKHITKLENLITQEKQFHKIEPRKIIEEIDLNESKTINVDGTITVKADEFLTLALKELIRNAFKHTETPKVDITLINGNDSKKIMIQDYGQGLSQATINSHFQNRKKQRELKGLTIVEKIMDRYNGDFRYKKNEKGSLFELVWYKN
ncbi:MAG: hypothetical protein EU541_08090 [Promethearchaeota archaeon]|nr:MAG: hypothetical protein EU541_08090 [Candidatus Lokiarchaeota archaeon]